MFAPFIILSLEINEDQPSENRKGRLFRTWKVVSCQHLNFGRDSKEGRKVEKRGGSRYVLIEGC